jgi:hypothetical protein
MPPDATKIEVRPGDGRPLICRVNSSRRGAKQLGSTRCQERSWVMMGEGARSRAYNGMPAGELRGAHWWKSGRSSAQGNCIETAKLPSHEVAIRNSRHPQGPALIFSQAEVWAFLEGVKDGDFDDLL